MTTSEFSQDLLILLSKMNRYQLAIWLKIQVKPYGTRAADRSLDIIKQLQIALGNYSKTHQFDYVQEKMLAVLTKIEKWVRLEYYRVKREEIIKDHPDWDQKEVNRILVMNWENYFKSRCY